MGVGCQFRPVLNLNKPTQQIPTTGLFRRQLGMHPCKGVFGRFVFIGNINGLHPKCSYIACLSTAYFASGRKIGSVIVFFETVYSRLSRCYATHGVGVMLRFLAFAHMVAATPRTGCGWGGGVVMLTFLAKESIPPGLHTLLGDGEVNPKTSVVQKVAGELH